jgi:ubiquinone/menaquinone biosynthesis C-methylase UbiE
MSNAISFDRAADFYDQTRGFPPGITPKAAALIAQAGALTATSRVLEIGIGTGRVALPLAAHTGGRVHGVDISHKMMVQIFAKDGGDVIPIQADAACLPYANNSINALLAVHIFHLLPDFTPVEREMRRILKPDGVLLQCWNTNDSTLKEARRLADAANNSSRSNRWTQATQYMEQVGWRKTQDDLHMPFVMQQTPQQVLDGFSQRKWSSTWELSDEDLARGVQAMRDYLTERYDDLNTPVDIHNDFYVSVYRQT